MSKQRYVSRASAQTAIAALVLPKHLPPGSEENIRWADFIQNDMVKFNDISALYLAGKGLSINSISHLLNMPKEVINVVFEHKLPVVLDINDKGSLESKYQQARQFAQALFVE